MLYLFRSLSGATLAFGLAITPIAALAQDTGAPAQGEATTPAVTGEKLDSFVLAMVEIAEVRQEYGPKIQEAKDDSERQAIATEGNKEIQQRVDGVPGITFDEYVQIANAASADPALENRITQRLDEMKTE